MLSLRYACIRSSGVILIQQVTYVPKIVSFVASIAEKAHGEISGIQSLTQSLTQSPSLFDAPEAKVIAWNNCIIVIATADK